MTVNHRAEAEKHLANAARHLNENPADMRIAEVAAWIGQGHANLVRNEDRAATTADMQDAITLLRRREYDTREAVAEHIANALTSGNKEVWKGGRGLAGALDDAGLNVEREIDNRLRDAGYNPMTAWNTPGSGPDTSRGWGGYSAPAEVDPWADAPAVPAEIPEAVRSVIAGHLAEALLDGHEGDIKKWARGIAYELKRVGADLTGDIEKRITALTLGPDPSDPPF